MSAVFGKPQSREKTILLLDVENGSVGAALARISPRAAPRVFGEKRIRTPLLSTYDANFLIKEIEKAARDACVHASEVAARIRAHTTLSPMGTIARTAVFLHAPWSSLDFEESETPTITATESILESLRPLARTFFSDVPLSFHSFGAATSPIVHSLFETPQYSLVCTASAEVMEFLLVDGDTVWGHATIPMGSHTLLRTLKTHAGLSEAEARSAMRLSLHAGIESGVAGEALRAATLYFLEEFAQVVHKLLLHQPLERIYVVAEEPFAQWFAQALADESLEELFPDGGEVRAVEARHLIPHIAAHAPSPDVSLILGSLFADARWSGI